MKFKPINSYLIATILLGASLSASAANVTFQVNMSVQMAQGHFDPATDSLTVGAGFNSWSTSASQLTQSGTDPNLWTGTFDVSADTPGSVEQYKFIMNTVSGGVQWEGHVGSYGGTGNRGFTVPTSDLTLPVVYFNNVTNNAVNVAAITFQVNMSVQMASGAFDPASGTVVVSGDAINNWSTSASALTQSLADTNLWAGTFNVTNPVGSTVAFSYVMNGGTWETIAGSRTFVMPSTATNLPAVYFNNITVLAIPIDLTFSVNLGVMEARGTFNPDNGDFVEVRGSFLTSSGGAWLGGFQLTNSPASPILYTGTWTTTNSPGASIQYQAVINGGTWETGGHYYTLTDTNHQYVPLFFPNNVNDLGTLTMGPVAAGQRTFNWMAGPKIRLQESASLTSGWTDVSNTEGQSSATVTVVPGNQFFRLIGP
jgi:hypothetical protein